MLVPKSSAGATTSGGRTEMENLNVSAPTMRSTSRMARMRSRLGAREELAAGLVLLLLAVGAMAFTLVTGQGTPGNSALAYLSAVDRADTSYVWNNSILDTSQVSKADVALVDRKALAAQLAASAHTRSDFQVQSTSVFGDTTVTLSYRTSTGQKSTPLVMRGEGPNTWYVVLHPAGLALTVPGGAGALAIDGQPVDATAGSEIKVAVLPGTHQLTLAPSDLFLSYAGQLDAQLALPRFTPVSFAKAQLTDSGIAAAKGIVSQALADCAKSGQLSPAGCPQSFLDVAEGQVSWVIIGDPMASSSIQLDDKSVLEVSGHYVMTLSYTSQTKGYRLLAVGAPYLATLAWDGQALKFAAFEDASTVPDAPLPAASDNQVLTALKARMDACLRVQDGSPPDCPQSVVAFYASNFVWHADVDPMQGASVAWDGKRSLFTVAGNYSFSVDYDSTPPYSGTRHYHDTDSGRYTADLYWDGSKIVFVAFEK